MFSCQECGRKFGTAKAAYRASVNGCPKCSSVDIDLASEERATVSIRLPLAMNLGEIQTIGIHRVERVAAGWLVDECFTSSPRGLADCLNSPTACKKPELVLTNFED